MRSPGFEPAPKSYLGWQRSDGVWVLDARADNFILTEDGVVPIDLVMEESGGGRGGGGGLPWTGGTPSGGELAERAAGVKIRADGG